MNNIPQISRNCGQCSQPASKQCSNCHKIFYCSTSCQKLDRSTHRPHCFPFVREGNVINRMNGVNYFATRDISKGSVILEESPLLIGPSEALNNNVCLGCNKVMDFFNPCSKCDWPVCSQNCEMIAYHFPECKVFVENKVNFDPSQKHRHRCIRTLRAVLLREQNPGKFAQLLNLFQYVDPKEENLSMKDISLVVDFVRRTCSLSTIYEEDLIQKIMKIDASFGSCPVDRITTHVIKPIQFSIHHSCIPNTRIIDAIIPPLPDGKPKPPRTTLILASVDIATGDRITTTASNSIGYQTTLFRREKLHEQLGYWCECPRCADPTELGTYFSALKCTACTSGYVLPSTPLIVFGPWSCDLCPATMTYEEVGGVIERPGAEVIRLEALGNQCDLGTFSSDPITPEGYIILSQMEKFLEKYGPLLHPNNALIFTINRYVSAGYLAILKRREATLSDHVRQKRLGMIGKMMDYSAAGWNVTKVLFPGISSFRAKTLLLLTLSKWLKLKELVISPGGLSEVESLARECIQLKKELEEILQLLEKKEERGCCEDHLSWITTTVKMLTRANLNPGFVSRILPIIQEE